MIGGSLFLIALGAILKYAIVDRADDVNLYNLGGILMWVGVIGLIIGIVLYLVDSFRSRRYGYDDVDEVHVRRRPFYDRW